VRGAAQACRVAPSGQRSDKLDNGGKFRVFDRDNYLWIKTLNENPNVVYVASEANMPIFKSVGAK
jgi:hypothetical protein